MNMSLIVRLPMYDPPGEKVTCDGRANMVRQLSCVVFSEDKEVMFGGTTTGDFVIVTSKDRKLRRTVPACKLGVLSILCWGHGVLIGGGDGTVSLFDLDMVKITHLDLKGGVLALSFSADKAEVSLGFCNFFCETGHWIHL
jgi:hypothetical protein